MTESPRDPRAPPSPEPPPRRLEYAVRLPHRGWVWYSFLACFLATAWFLVVLYGEVNNWTARPDEWALLATSLWALLGMALLVLTATYFLLLLIRREVSQRAYIIASAARVAGQEPPPPPAKTMPSAPLEPQPTRIVKLPRKERKALKKAEKHKRKEEKRAAKYLAKQERRRA